MHAHLSSGTNFVLCQFFLCVSREGSAQSNCLGQFREIPWNQTTDVHRGSTLITRSDNVKLMLYNMTLTSQNHVKTITSVIAAKKTGLNKEYVFSINIAIAISYLKILTHLA